MRNILRKLPGSSTRSRSKSKNRKERNERDEKKESVTGDNDDNVGTKEEHLRVPKINACDLKVKNQIESHSSVH